LADSFYSHLKQLLTSNLTFQLRVSPSKMSESTDTSEVLYNESATELFLAIEEMEWRDAFDIISSDPKQVRTWVNNSGTGNTTLNLSSWRRLPIHEACMRRAPAWLVSELLTKFPESSSLTTNLGEYPLHLAVDKACSPEVVNLIIVANWSAIVAQDHTGRTPIDIIDHTELLENDINQVIFESLKRCHKTYIEIGKVNREEKAALIWKQKAKTNAVSKIHQQEIKAEQAKQAQLEDEIKKLKRENNMVRELAEDNDHEVQKHILAKNRYLETIRDLKTKGAARQRELETERAQIKVLLFKLEQKEEEIHRKTIKIDVLSKDLKSIVVSNETEILESLIETEQSMRTMVSTQIALQKLLSSKSKGLKTLMKQRGIAVPDVHKSQSPEADQEEKSMHDEENAIHEAAASAAMMAAATAALHSKA